MADTHGGYIGDVQKAEADAAKRTFYIEVGTAEAQTVTVSKAGGAYAATGGTTSTAVTGTEYKLVIHVDDIDTLGQVKFLSTGATDSKTVVLNVVDYDPFLDGAKSDRARKVEMGRPR